MRDGRVVGEGERGGVDRQWIVERMSGAVADAVRSGCGTCGRNVSAMLEVLGLLTTDGGADCGARTLVLRLGAGEMVGIYGLLGSGRTELLEALAGLGTLEAGEVRVGWSARYAWSRLPMRLARGLRWFRRIGRGMDWCRSCRSGRISAWLPCRTLRAVDGCGGGRRRRGCGDCRADAHCGARSGVEGDYAERRQSAEGSAGAVPDAAVRRCCCWTSRRAAWMLAAKAEIYRMLRELAAKGLSVLFATSEIEEARTLADRVLVMVQGS